MDHSNRLFRKAVFGGFNKDDVIDYIESMKNEFFEYKKQVEETINELHQKINELEQIASRAAVAASSSVSGQEPQKGEDTKTDKPDNVGFSVTAINEATDHLKATADRLCENLTEFMDRISTSCISVTVEAPVSEAEKTACEPNPDGDEAEAQEPSPQEVADDYRQSIQARGEAVLSDVFGDSTSDAPAKADDTFSQFLDSILSAPEAHDDASEEESEKQEPSVLDELLSSSKFFN